MIDREYISIIDQIDKFFEMHSPETGLYQEWQMKLKRVLIRKTISMSLILLLLQL